MQISSSFNSDPDFITANATPATALTLPISPNNTVSVVVRVIARGLTDGSSAMIERQAVVKSVSGGALSLVGSVVNTFTAQLDAGASTWAVNFSLSGNNILVQVTGSASQRVGWFFIAAAYGFSNYNRLQGSEIA